MKHGGRAAVLLQQLAGEHPAAEPGGVQARGLDGGPQFAQGTLQPGQQVRPVDHCPDGRRRGGGHAAVLDRGRAARRGQQGAQRLDRGPRLGQLGLQPVQVRGDEGVAGGRVRCGQHRLDVGDWHLQVAQAADDLRGRDLPGRVVPVAVSGFTVAGSSSPTWWVVAQCLDAEVRGAGEVAHGEPCRHQAIVDPPVTGESMAECPVDPPAKGAPRVESSA
jgi:hypothetical protein